MNLLKEVTNALKTVINWIWMIYLGVCEFIGISEWVIISLGITVVTFVISISIYKARH